MRVPLIIVAATRQQCVVIQMEVTSVSVSMAIQEMARTAQVMLAKKISLFVCTTCHRLEYATNFVPVVLLSTSNIYKIYENTKRWLNDNSNKNNSDEFRSGAILVTFLKVTS